MLIASSIFYIKKVVGTVIPTTPGVEYITPILMEKKVELIMKNISAFMSDIFIIPPSFYFVYIGLKSYFDFFIKSY